MDQSIHITHVMADGTVRDSVAGVVIKNDHFYRVLKGILEKQNNNRKQPAARSSARK